MFVKFKNKKVYKHEALTTYTFNFFKIPLLCKHVGKIHHYCKDTKGDYVIIWPR